MIKSSQDDHALEGVKSSTQEATTRVLTTVSHDAPKQLTTIREAAPLVLTLTGATFLNTFSAQAVVILIPTISKLLNIPAARQQWIVSAYALTLGCFLVLCGKLGDICGKRVLFVLGCIWIAAISIGVAFSPSEICFDVLRALQGLGAAITIPTSMGILGATIPPGRVKNYSFAFYQGGAPVGQILGNILGGIIAQYSSWKVVFFLIAGANLAVGILGIISIPKESKAVDLSLLPQMDWVGVFLFTTSLFLLLVALSQGDSIGWSTPYVIALLVVSVVMFIGFVLFERYLEFRTSREPLIKTSVFQNSRFALAVITITFFSAAFTNFLIYSTYLYQDYQLLDIIHTALRFVPLGIVGIFTATVSGYLLDRVRGNYILSFGLISHTISNILMAAPIPPSTTYWAYGFPAMILAAFGADTCYPCLGLFISQSLPRKDQGLAGGMFQTVTSIGKGIALAIASAIETSVQKRDEHHGMIAKEALLHGLRSVQWFNVAFSLVALVATVVGLRNMGKIGLLKKLGQVQGLEKQREKENGEA